MMDEKEKIDDIASDEAVISATDKKLRVQITEEDLVNNIFEVSVDYVRITK